jgi:hypothetical protein
MNSDVQITFFETDITNVIRFHIEHRDAEYIRLMFMQAKGSVHIINAMSRVVELIGLQPFGELEL